MQSKSTLRKLALSKRNALPEEERAALSHTICEDLYKFFLEKLRASSTNGQVEGHILRSDTDPNQLVENNEIKFPKFFRKEFRASSTNGQVESHILRSDTDPNQQVELTGLNIALYEAINSEVNLRELALALSNSGAKVLKPIMMSEEEGVMEFTNWENAFDPRETLSLKSWQPSLTLVKPEEIDIIICPVVAFDSECNRLGYGGGYYDRYLPRMSPSTLKIGVAFACQQVEEIPRDPHDIPLDCIFTE